jgi:alpha-beta hydrolase superfamily lysophospholipase
MNLLILGGYSDYNKEWVENIQKTLADLFESTDILYYENWSNYREDADISSEVERLREVAKEKDNLVIFGKSVGVALTLQAIHNGYIKPKKCIFVGTPYEWSIKNGWDMDILLKDFAVPVLFLQQTEDLSTSFQTIKNLLEKSGVKDYKIVELPGGDHQYNSMDEIRKYSEPFIIN